MSSSTLPQLPKALADALLSRLLTPETLAALATAIVGGLMGLVQRLTSGGAGKPSLPVTSPAPNPGADPGFPDDRIPEPATKRNVARVRLRLARAQFNRELFPAEYTADNPQGLYSNEQLRDVEAGRSALNRKSKFWLDLTAYDDAGQEFLRPAVLAHGLAYQTEHHAGEAFIVGAGADPNGAPLPYQTNDTDTVGNGITAWTSSLGFLHQMKAHGEGAFECSGKVAGRESNRFTIRVS